MPMSSDFEKRLSQVVKKACNHFKTPFHIYDEKGIKETANALNYAFSNIDGFKEFFAVKALPNPRIMSIMKKKGFGFDCSSSPEVLLSRSIKSFGEEIMFTSNNTSINEFSTALQNKGCILNLDDISLIAKIPKMPELISFRYNPGPRRKGNKIIGNPVESKYGISHEQILPAYEEALKRGAKRFGMHTMLASNELNHEYMIETTKMLLDMVDLVSGKLNIEFEFINIGGGLGIPYQPDQPSLNINLMAKGIKEVLDNFKASKNFMPKLFMESGRYM
ncbi:MAG: diaminopimelate decarboxylase, partial [Desulfobacteraceae bacterium]|nr:diaminopimelate decarboxylase [Desulfobacteraceae bacterium]